MPNRLQDSHIPAHGLRWWEGRQCSHLRARQKWPYKPHRSPDEITTAQEGRRKAPDRSPLDIHDHGIEEQRDSHGAINPMVTTETLDEGTVWRNGIIARIQREWLRYDRARLNLGRSQAFAGRAEDMADHRPGVISGPGAATPCMQGGSIRFATFRRSTGWRQITPCG